MAKCSLCLLASLVRARACARTHVHARMHTHTHARAHTHTRTHARRTRARWRARPRWHNTVSVCCCQPFVHPASALVHAGAGRHGLQVAGFLPRDPSYAEVAAAAKSSRVPCLFVTGTSDALVSRLGGRVARGCVSSRVPILTCVMTLLSLPCSLLPNTAAVCVGHRSHLPFPTRTGAVVPVQAAKLPEFDKAADLWV